MLHWESSPTLRDTLFYCFLECGAGGRLVFNSYQDGWQHLYSPSERQHAVNQYLAQRGFVVPAVNYRLGLTPNDLFLRFHARAKKAGSVTHEG